jgi:catechol 2,3-dioxygenase-like lactoylglutathione lyase family enzyme
MTGMDITVHASFLPHDDPEASLAFYRDVLGFEVRSDVGQGTMRWITVAPPISPTRPSSWRRRPPTPASPTTSAAPSPR